MRDKYHRMKIPAEQRMERQESIAREHSEEYHAALQRAVALDIPQAYSPSSYGTFHEIDVGEDSARSSAQGSSLPPKKRTQSWNEFVGRLFDVDDSGSAWPPCEHSNLTSSERALLDHHLMAVGYYITFRNFSSLLFRVSGARGDQ
ncbi:hypothetical protein E2542_SST13798 [Spatholobus suberectus]|nr:hypothetical protein E2542_SST13798 [Spatholobus suberectus]